MSADVREMRFFMPTGLSVQLALLSGAFIFSFQDVMLSLWRSWGSSEDYSHGFFIVPIALYIVWQKRRWLAGLQTHPSTAGGWYLAVLLTGSIVARYAEIVTLSSMFMVLTLASLILFVAGWEYLKELLFPLTLLFFMIPIPEQVYSALTVPLQLLVSHISVATAILLDIPTYREGNVIHLPGHTLEVVQACSGLRSLMSLITINLIMGYLFLRSTLLRSVMLVSALPLAILVNCLRVFITIIILHFFQFDLTDGSVHTLFGATMFLVALLLLNLIQKGLARWDR